MKSYQHVTAFIVGLCVVAAIATDLHAQDAEQQKLILDTSAFWRVHYTLRAPVFAGQQQEKSTHPFGDTKLPSKDWMRPDFDDAEWNRLPGAPFPDIKSTWCSACRLHVGFISTDYSSPCLALICSRAKFNVSDPVRVKSLSLSLDYRGGAVVYLNGKEVARQHLPKTNKLNMTALADNYPVEAFVKPGGKILDANRGEKNKEHIRRWQLRTRKITSIAIPTKHLRKGVNVLAVEIHRAPYHDEVRRKVIGDPRRMPSRLWSTCGIVRVQLTADKDAAVTPNVLRPKGLQVWNSAVMAADFDLDFGDPNDKLRPISIVGTPGGMFSGKVVVGSEKPINGLKAAVGDMTRTGGGGSIDKASIQVRYAVPTSGESGALGRYTWIPGFFDGLQETPLEKIPVRAKKKNRGNWQRPGQPDAVFGAVQPVWVTISIPTNTKPGDYTGRLTISADKDYRVSVPVELKVCEWKLPPASNFSTLVDFVQSPESVALQYKTPIYGDRHFELLAESLKRLGEVGNQSLYIPLVCQTNQGNSQSMVRWIRKPGDGYEHDFSVVERYLDLAIKHMGKPRIVCVYAWDTFLGTGPGGDPVPVSMLDRKSGKVTTIELPRYSDDGNEKLWKPVADGIRRIMKKRGLEGAMLMGLVPDSAPAACVVKLWGKLLPGVKWMRHAHSSRRNLQGAPIGYQCLVWTPRFATSADESKHGWKHPQRFAQFCRSQATYPLNMARLLGEMNIQGQQCGFGRVGLDFWPVLEVKGRRQRNAGTIQARYPKTSWRNLDWMINSFVPAGPKGALSTARLMMMREGLQECEARIFIEKALLDKKLSARMGKRLVGECRTLLRERQRCALLGLDNHLACGFAPPSTNAHNWWSAPGQVGYLWYVSSGWQKRSAELYSMAARVQKATR